MPVACRPTRQSLLKRALQVKMRHRLPGKMGKNIGNRLRFVKRSSTFPPTYQPDSVFHSSFHHRKMTEHRDLTNAGVLDILIDNHYHVAQISLRIAMESTTDTATGEQRMAQMVSKLKDHDFRITPQRLAVLRVLAVSDGHPSVEEIFETVRKEFPTTTIATVYRTVHLLKQIDEVLEIAFPDGGNRYDGNKPFPHPHIICVHCKRIIHPALGPLEEIMTKVAEETGFDILSHRLDFFGVCGDCRNLERDRSPGKSTNAPT